VSVSETLPGGADFSAFVDLFDQYRVHYGQPADRDRAEAWLTEATTTGPMRAFLARVDGAAAGMCLIAISPASLSLGEFWVVRDLFVDPRWRRTGVGRALLDAVCDAATQRGALRLTVQTEDENAAALRLYERYGFRRVTGLRSLTFPLDGPTRSNHERRASRESPAAHTPAPIPTLSDGHAMLRASEPRDLPVIEAGIHDPDVVRWIGPPEGSAQEVLVRNEEHWAHGSPTLSICELDGTCLGLVWLNVSETDRSAGTVGYWLLPAGRGRGLATSAVRLLSDWAMSDLGVTNIRLTTAPDNQRSQLVAERSGFRRVQTPGGDASDGRQSDQIVFELDPPRAMK
jgi:RimJ/RimL family protein N-acetyltransferase